MARVVLDKLWLHQQSSPSIYVSLDFIGVMEEDSVPGEVRQGTTRYRFITKGIEHKILEFTVELVDRSSTLEDLRALKGAPLILRDSTGRLVYGVMPALSVIEQPNVDIGTVGLVTFRFEETFGTAEV